MLFLQYPPCSTCQKAKKWLDSHGISYTDRHIKEQNPTYEELKHWYEVSGLPLKKFFNTSGLLYKSMELKTKLLEMTEEKGLIVGLAGEKLLKSFRFYAVFKDSEDYTVRCEIREGRASLLKLEISVPDEKQAEQM